MNRADLDQLKAEVLAELLEYLKATRREREDRAWHDRLHDGLRRLGYPAPPPRRERSR